MTPLLRAITVGVLTSSALSNLRDPQNALPFSAARWSSPSSRTSRPDLDSAKLIAVLVQLTRPNEVLA
jgi:hypothetical protein